ncbi:hypothetical protein O3M35_009227 [Rhynocoris fuscipes]|uniref:C2HC/C3H-type domain-containing protein n=1 Tax=Rhynocoris fuscipes TaxID=488301 RepID=A0AAW1D4D4_9HEMI
MASRGKSAGNGRPKSTSRALKRDSGRVYSRGGGAKPWEDHHVQVELIPCKVCNRRFTHDRVQLHQKICEKVFDKKRKPYDTTKHRWLGIVPDNQIKNLQKIKNPPNLSTVEWQSQHNAWSGKTGAKPSSPNPRSANPSIVTSNSSVDNRILCRGCKRKFAPAPAERHIPFCEGKHNIS